MENSNWHETDNWYEPAPQRQTAEAAQPTPKKRRKRRGWTPWRVVGVILLLTLLILGTSIAFSDRGSVAERPAPPRESAEPKADSPSKLPAKTPEPKADDPDDWRSFFETFFQTVEMDKLDVGIEQAALPIEFTLELQSTVGEEKSLRELYEACEPSIVGVLAWRKGERSYSWATGIVLSEDGLILTNAHVVNETDFASVLLGDGEEREALLVGADIASDLAVLKIEAEGLSAATFGQSAELHVGDPVAAIGNPLGEEFSNTLTDGIISAIERGVSYRGRTMTLLQTNAALNEGNSGGALLNREGQIVGVTNMKMLSSYSNVEGIGFAIPSSTVRTVVNALVRDGEVRGRPVIGITVGGISEAAAEQYDLPVGLYVSDVTKGSDAERSGVKPGDIVTAVNGTPVKTTEQVAGIKNALKVGDEIVLSIWRDGAELEITVVLMDNNDVYGK